MHDITDIVVGITNKRVKELAYQIKDEIQAQIRSDIRHPDRSTHTAENSFEVHWNGSASGGDFEAGAGGSFGGGFLTSVEILSNAESAYYLDQGNGGPGVRIASTRPYDRKGRRPGKLELAHIGSGIYANSVKGYKGTHYIKKVADRHR